MYIMVNWITNYLPLHCTFPKVSIIVFIAPFLGNVTCFKTGRLFRSAYLKEICCKIKVQVIC